MRFSLLTLVMVTFLVAVYCGLHMQFPWAAFTYIPPLMAGLTAAILCCRWQPGDWKWITLAGMLAAMLAAAAWIMETTAIGYLRFGLVWLDVNFFTVAFLFVALHTCSGLIVALVLSGLNLGLHSLVAMLRQE